MYYNLFKVDGDDMDKNVTNSKNNSAKYIILILLLISGFCFFEYFSYSSHQNEIFNLKNNCSPVSTDGEAKELALDSNIVIELYNKVHTTIREDLAAFELNDSMKLYLAYRQIPNSEFYDSNCNLFSDTAMYSYSCSQKEGFVPRAFKEEALKVQFVELFGEDSSLSYNHIQLDNSCIGGYQYIEKRGEYVEGECNSVSATTFKADKNLVKAISQGAVITLKEKVKYYGNEGKDLPNHLKSGTYVYTFKLDTNYNYIYVSKTFEQ